MNVPGCHVCVAIARCCLLRTDCLRAPRVYKATDNKARRHAVAKSTATTIHTRLGLHVISTSASFWHASRMLLGHMPCCPHRHWCCLLACQSHKYSAHTMTHSCTVQANTDVECMIALACRCSGRVGHGLWACTIGCDLDMAAGRVSIHVCAMRGACKRRRHGMWAAACHHGSMAA
jgi:hypothetical protein